MYADQPTGEEPPPTNLLTVLSGIVAAMDDRLDNQSAQIVAMQVNLDALTRRVAKIEKRLKI